MQDYKYLMEYKYFIFYILVFMSFGVLTNSQENVYNVYNVSPTDIVKKWIEIYGRDFDEASELTTLSFRNGITKKDWASKISKIMESIEYEHLGGKVVAEITKKDKSINILQSKIKTIVGGSYQKEVYELHNIEGKWLINEIVVKEEDEFGESSLEKEI